MAVKLAVEEIGKDFLIPVIDSVSFTVEAGEFVCLLGPNGCGKTTLLRILGGIEPATRGRVLLDGRPRTVIVPPSGWTAPVRILTRVLLPAPLAPRSAWTSPGRTASDAERSATTAP